jgi:hypothetical protein
MVVGRRGSTWGDSVVRDASWTEVSSSVLRGTLKPRRREAEQLQLKKEVEGCVTEHLESLVDAARTASGIGTVYRALDELVELYALEDAAVVVEVPGFGRQVLHAGRRPLHDDERGLHAAAPGLYLQPPLDDRVLTDLMLALGTLAFRYDTRTSGSTGELPGP